AAVGHLAGHAPRTQRPVLRHLRRADDARLLAPMADSDERGMTLPNQSLSRQPTNTTPAGSASSRPGCWSRTERETYSHTFLEQPLADGVARSGHCPTAHVIFS